MDYPKRFMSIKELKELGLSETFLRRISHYDKAPVVSGGYQGCRTIFDTNELDSFMREMATYEQDKKRRMKYRCVHRRRKLAI